MNHKVQIVVLVSFAVALCAPAAFAKGGGGGAVGGGQPTHSHMSPAYIDWYMSTHGGHVPVDPPITGGKPITFGQTAHPAITGNPQSGTSGGLNTPGPGNNNGQSSGCLFNVPPGSLFNTN